MRGLDWIVKVSVNVRSRTKSPSRTPNGGSPHDPKFLWSLFRIMSMLVALSIVPGTVEWRNEPTLVIVARHLDDAQDLSTELGQQKELRVAGLRAVANTNTKALFHTAWGHHTIEFEMGEILLETDAQSSTPLLLVATKGVEVAAANAKFSVLRPIDRGPCTISVYEGTASLRIDGPSYQTGMPRGSIVAVKLTRSQSLILFSGRPQFSDFDRETEKGLLSWLGGNLVFKSAPLAEVVAEFNRYNRERLKVADDSIGKVHLGGSYPANDPEHFAEELRPLGILAQRRSSGEHGEIVIELTKAPSSGKPHAGRPRNHEPSRRKPKAGT